MGKLLPGDPASMLRIEFNLSKPVRDALTSFTEASNTESLRVYSGAARIVDRRAMYGRPIRESGEVTEDDTLPGRISELRSGLADSATKLIRLSNRVELRREGDYSRLFIEPSHPEDLEELTDLFEQHLPYEIANKEGFEKYLYVDLSGKLLADNALKRVHAIREFKKMAVDPSLRNAFYVNNPTLQITDFIMPQPKTKEEQASSHPDIIEDVV